MLPSIVECLLTRLELRRCSTRPPFMLVGPRKFSQRSMVRLLLPVPLKPDGTSGYFLSLWPNQLRWFAWWMGALQSSVLGIHGYGGWSLLPIIWLCVVLQGLLFSLCPIPLATHSEIIGPLKSGKWKYWFNGVPLVGAQSIHEVRKADARKKDRAEFVKKIWHLQKKWNLYFAKISPINKTNPLQFINIFCKNLVVVTWRIGQKLVQFILSMASFFARCFPWIPRKELNDNMVYWSPVGSIQESFLRFAILDHFMGSTRLFSKRTIFFRWAWYWLFPVWGGLVVLFGYAVVALWSVPASESITIFKAQVVSQPVAEFPAKAFATQHIDQEIQHAFTNSGSPRQETSSITGPSVASCAASYTHNKLTGKGATLAFLTLVWLFVAMWTLYSQTKSINYWCQITPADKRQHLPFFLYRMVNSNHKTSEYISKISGQFKGTIIYTSVTGFILIVFYQISNILK